MAKTASWGCLLEVWKCAKIVLGDPTAWESLQPPDSVAGGGRPPVQESHPRFGLRPYWPPCLVPQTPTKIHLSHGLDRQTLCEASHWVILPPRQSTPTLPDELFKTELYTLWDKFSS